jgi:hypothetical protein
MKEKKVLNLSLLVILILGFCTSLGMANIWMDESFDESSAFIEGNGAGTAVSPANATLDVFSYNAIVKPMNADLTSSGTKITSKKFDGVGCYELDASQTITVGPSYQDPANGNYMIFQFAVNVDPIPAAGQVGIFKFLWDTDSTAGASPDHRFYVKLTSDGTKVNIYAGEDLNHITPLESKIGELTTVTDWKFITMAMQNATGTLTYTTARVPGGALTMAEGVGFYCSSTTQASFIAFGSPNGTNKKGMGWEITATQKMFVDTIYFEGGMDNTAYIDPTGLNAVNIKAFDYSGSSGIDDWSIYK